jgi:toxin ParE1/3/4
VNRYSLAGPARRDLNEIWERCTEDAGIETADRLIDSLVDCFLMLAAMPGAGRQRDDVATDIRTFPSGNYLIYYLKTGRARIRILRVIHGRRDQKKAWREPGGTHRHR